MAADDPLAPFRADPAASAILLDVDGTLSPIVPHPDLSAVPASTLALLGRLVERFALVGCVSGRAADDVLRLVPVPGLAVSGNHGLEIAEDGVVRSAPAAAPYLAAVSEVARRLAPVAEACGAWVEDKGVTLAVHYRQAPDPPAAERHLRDAALPIVAEAGLAARFGRMVLEVRPPVPLDKGTAVRQLLEGRPVVRSLFAGDDTTDLDAFAVVDVAVAVLSPESPPGLAEAAAVHVQGTDGLAELLRSLLDD